MLFNRISNRLAVHYGDKIQLKRISSFMILPFSSNSIRIHRYYVTVNIKRSEIFNCMVNFERNMAKTANADDKIIAVQEVIFKKKIS